MVCPPASYKNQFTEAKHLVIFVNVFNYLDYKYFISIFNHLYFPRIYRFFEHYFIYSVWLFPTIRFLIFFWYDCLIKNLLYNNNLYQACSSLGIPVGCCNVECCRTTVLYYSLVDIEPFQFSQSHKIARDPYDPSKNSFV